MKIGLFLCLISAIGLLGSAANSAEIRLLPKKITERQGVYFSEIRGISLTGRIVKGDADKLDEIVKSISKTERNQFDKWLNLYLNSPGGSFGEGLKIAALVRKIGIGTRVLENDSCLSACAIIFMHGTHQNIEDGESLDRRMHRTAIVGFHAPHLNIHLPAGRAMASADAEASIESAYSFALRSFSKLLESGNKLFSTDLLIKMLRTPPKEMITVKSFGDMIHWRIELIDAPRIVQVDNRKIVVACLNMSASEASERPETRFSDNSDVATLFEPKLVQTWPNGTKWYRVLLRDYDGYECNLKIKKIDGKFEVQNLGFTYGSKKKYIDEPYGTSVSYPFFRDPRDRIQ